MEIPKSINHQDIKKQFPLAYKNNYSEEFKQIINPDFITWASSSNQPGFEIVSFPKVFLLIK